MIELIQASEFRIVFQDVIILLLSICAILWGARPERFAIGIWLLFLEVPTLMYREVLENQMFVTGVDVYLAAADALAGLAWITLALFANRSYTLWIAGAQLLAVGAHISRALIESISPISYLFMVIAPGWLILLAMSIGFTRHILRKRKFGEYRDWRISRKQMSFRSVEKGSPPLAGLTGRGAPQKEPDQ